MKYNIKSIKEKVTKISDEEHVNREEALTAIAVLNQLRVFSKGDYLLYLASINLLNRFAKLNVGVLNNRFRYYLYPIIYQIMQEKPNNINIYSKINYKRHQIPFLIIDIDGFQFSFHRLDYNIIQGLVIENQFQFTTFKWDYIDKQKCASSLFDLALNHNDNLTGVSVGNKDLLTSVMYSLEKYKKNQDINNPIRFIHHNESLKSIYQE